MAFRASRCLILLVGLLLLASSWLTGTEAHPSSLIALAEPNSRSLTQGDGVRRVNAPYDVPGEEAAILWFGRVTPTANSVDARVCYKADHLFVRLAAFDRRLWYDRSPSPNDLTAWDATTLYLDLDGNVGHTPDTNTYRFDAQLSWWEPRDNYQAAYVGHAGGWLMTTMPFTTTPGWRSVGSHPNDDLDDRGWALKYLIPYQSLGLSGPPAPGTVWGLALALHDRDDATGTPIADQVWPETMQPLQPATWGQLAFGMPTYDPPPAVPGATVTIRHGLNGATVVDGAVGGGSTCGGGLNYWTEWGEANYAGLEQFNIQNLWDIGDWPCFSRYYVTFPLDALPTGKTIISATLTLRQWGNAGQGYTPGPQPSLIQVLTIDQAWDEHTLTWNNAPLALENVSTTWAYPLDPPGWPGVPREWDVSRAVAEAYAAGAPLRLALYEADGPYHSGKYFYASDTGAWNAEGRPTLTVTWGHAVADLTKTATPSASRQGQPITYALSFRGTGNPLTLTDTLPLGLSAPGSFGLAGTSVTPTYDSAQHRLRWTDTPAAGQEVRISYVVAITASGYQALVNTAELGEGGSILRVASATVIANPHLTYLPLVRKGS